MFYPCRGSLCFVSWARQYNRNASHFPGVQLMGTVKLNALSVEGDGRIYPAMDYTIPSGDVLSFILGPVVIILLYWIWL